MLRLIVFLIIAAALAWVAVWLANSPGEVIVSWQATETVLPIGIAVAIIAAVTAAGIVVYEVWRWIAGLPRKIRDNRQQRRQIRGYQELTHGLIAAAAGDVTGARVHTRQAEKLLDANAATLLLSAQTAQLEGKEDVAQLKFQQMMKKPQTEFLGIRGLLADAVKRGDQEEALELAKRAHARSPNTSWVLTTYFDLLTRAGNWAEAEALISDMAREKLLTGAEATRRRALMKHMQASEALEAGRDKEALDLGRKAAGLAPAFAPGAITAALAAKRRGRLRLAKRLIEDCWTLAPHPDLARAYADLVPDETAVERLNRCARLEKLRPDHLVSQMTMAELAMNARHWDTARQHLGNALTVSPTAGTYRLYAEYERASGGGDAKARDWLAKAADAPADRCWVCEDTGEVLASWQLFGPSGRFDSVHWDSPPTLAPMLRDQRPQMVLVQDQSAPPAKPAADTAKPPIAGKPPSDGKQPTEAKPVPEPKPVTGVKSAPGAKPAPESKPATGAKPAAPGGGNGADAKRGEAAAGKGDAGAKKDDDDEPGGRPPRSPNAGSTDQGLKAPPPIESAVKAAGGMS